MAAPDPKAQPTEGNRHPEDEVNEAHYLIEKCIQLYMDHDETARALEIHFGILRQLTRLIWDKLEECNQEFFQNYYTRLALKRQIIRFNESLEQQHQAMNSSLVPVERQMSMEPAQQRASSPVSKTSNENEQETQFLRCFCISSLQDNLFGPNLTSYLPILSALSDQKRWWGPTQISCPAGSLARSSLENAASDTAHMPISQVPNLTAGGHHTASFRGPL